MRFILLMVKFLAEGISGAELHAFPSTGPDERMLNEAELGFLGAFDGRRDSIRLGNLSVMAAA